MKNSILSLFLSVLFLAASPAYAAQFSVPSQVSQGHAFPVSVSDDRPFTAVFQWRGENIAVKSRPASPARQGLWKAEILLAVRLDEKGRLPLAVRIGDRTERFFIKTLGVAWPKSILTVAPKYVQPPKETLDKIALDRERSRQALAMRTEKAWDLPFFRPVPGGITSPFGGRRVFNGQPRAPHMGTDMRSPEGAPVMAAADGTVVLAEEQYFGGNTIYIDHGQGVFSIYCHLLEFNSSVGDTVKKGQVIARSGSTGRVTGPHLHFGFAAQGVLVDAMPLLASPPQVTGGPSRTLYEDGPKTKAAPVHPPKTKKHKAVKKKARNVK